MDDCTRWLVLRLDRAGPDTGLGPISSAFRDWLAPLMPDVTTSPIIAFVLKICTPQSIQSLSLVTFFSIALMWMLMSVAMTLPSAAPMLRTYADIADVAAQKGEPVVSVLVLAGGYLATWGLFSLLAAAAQMALMAIGWIADPIFPVQSFLGGVILMGAGFYQFSNLKNACLEKCRNPFSILFGRWSSETSGVFKLGTEQGLYCVGCCWALMLVMLVVGTMNLAWMAFFALFTIAEKSGKGPVTSRWSGGILLVWGAALVLISVMPVSLPAN